MCSCLDPMAQDIPMQDIPEQDESLPQMDPEPGMGAVAAAAAERDTSPPLLRNPPPIPAETAHPRAPGVAQLFAMLVELDNKIDGMTQILRGETRQAGQCLQADKMATPRAATNELKGSAPAGEDRVIRRRVGRDAWR